MPRGRKTDYKEEYNERAYRLCLLGFTEVELAATFNTSKASITTWKKKHPKFLASIRAGREEADAKVAEGLYKRAKGFERTIKSHRVVDGEMVTEEVSKYFPPESQAASLWLRNRHPDKWRDKVDHNLAGPDGGPLQGVVSRADEEL